MNQSVVSAPDAAQLISATALRRWIGVLGITLPWSLYVGYRCFNVSFDAPSSISHYYYTNMGTYFTAILSVVTIYLYAYRGYNLHDRIVTNFAAICASLVVFFPANMQQCNACSCFVANILFLPDNSVRNTIHYVAAILLFASFAYIALILFVKTDTTNASIVSKQKQQRNFIFKVCGYTIIVSMVSIYVFTETTLQYRSWVRDLHLNTFLFEAIALQAFGISWLIKGKTFFADKPQSNQPFMTIV